MGLQICSGNLRLFQNKKQLCFSQFLSKKRHFKFAASFCLHFQEIAKKLKFTKPSPCWLLDSKTVSICKSFYSNLRNDRISDKVQLIFTSRKNLIGTRYIWLLMFSDLTVTMLQLHSFIDTSVNCRLYRHFQPPNFHVQIYDWPLSSCLCLRVSAACRAIASRPKQMLLGGTLHSRRKTRSRGFAL